MSDRSNYPLRMSHFGPMTGRERIRASLSASRIARWAQYRVVVRPLKTIPSLCYVDVIVKGLGRGTLDQDRPLDRSEVDKWCPARGIVPDVIG